MILFKASSFGWFIHFIQLNQSASLLLLFKYDFINSSCLPEISSPTSDQHIDLLQEYSALRLQFSVWSVKVNDNCFYFFVIIRLQVTFISSLSTLSLCLLFVWHLEILCIIFKKDNMTLADDNVLVIFRIGRVYEVICGMQTSPLNLNL